MSFLVGNEEIASDTLAQNPPQNCKMTAFFAPRVLYRRKPTMSKPNLLPQLNSPTSVSRVATLWRLFQG
jgi:hypothetical protein